MSEYNFSEIHKDDRRMMRQLDALLQKEGIQRDQNLDYTVGLFNEEYQLIATGSCFGNTLRCMAVDSAHQGEGLLNQVISHLTEHEYQHGNTDLFLYTKYTTAHFFTQLGFCEVARAGGNIVFMENRRDGFRNYLQKLVSAGGHGRQAAAVINANPFTLGHQYLLERAAAACDTLHVFIVSEDVSLIPFSVREKLVWEGTAHLPNVVYHQTGNYIISNATFPSYFLKDRDTVISAHARLDVAVFAKIAKALDITVRFVGDEPFSRVTGIYNRILSEELPPAGIQCVILPRKSAEGTPISASTVRMCLKSGDYAALKMLVPETTYRYFISEQAQPILQKLRGCADVIHY